MIFTTYSINIGPFFRVS